ncbi:MAG: hypothetical protein IPO08_22655 [Xanthomonadales bacterium]|nr:hypothetical protein [Xanthomonadales bacterium]
MKVLVTYKSPDHLEPVTRVIDSEVEDYHAPLAEGLLTEEDQVKMFVGDPQARVALLLPDEVAVSSLRKTLQMIAVYKQAVNVHEARLAVHAEALAALEADYRAAHPDLAQSESTKARLQSEIVGLDAVVRGAGRDLYLGRLLSGQASPKQLLPGLGVRVTREPVYDVAQIRQWALTSAPDLLVLDAKKAAAYFKNVATPPGVELADTVTITVAKDLPAEYLDAEWVYGAPANPEPQDGEPKS